MSTKKLGGTGSGSAQIQRPQRQEAGRTRGTEKKAATGQSKATEQKTGLDVEGIDPRAFAGSTINGVQSPLTELVWSGVQQLAERNGWAGGQAHPMAMLMSALGSTEKPDDAFSKESRDATRRQFVSIGFERSKAGELVDLLAFVIAGLYTDPGAKKRSRENLIQHEIDTIRSGITDIQKTPLPEREAKLAKVLKDLLSRTNQLKQRTEGLKDKELPDALKVAPDRIRAAFSAVSIIHSHVIPQNT